jgi:predicted O-methyltransferase YrrM
MLARRPGLTAALGAGAGATLFAILARQFGARRALTLAATAGLTVAANAAFSEWRLRRYARGASAATMRAYQQAEELDRVYAKLEGRAALPPMRRWALSPDLAAILVDLIEEHSPGFVVELGSGSSTIVMARALERFGKPDAAIRSVDHEASFADISRGRVDREGLATRAEVVHAPLQSIATPWGPATWYDPAAFAGLPPIDLLVVDGPPESTGPFARRPALGVLAEHLAPGAVIVVDDASRPDERAMVADWQAAYPDIEVTRRPTEKGTAILRWAPPST